jgi:hypothetical protein
MAAIRLAVRLPSQEEDGGASAHGGGMAGCSEMNKGFTPVKGEAFVRNLSKPSFLRLEGSSRCPAESWRRPMPPQKLLRLRRCLAALFRS